MLAFFVLDNNKAIKMGAGRTLMAQPARFAASPGDSARSRLLPQNMGLSNDYYST
jgi:hypothetical protein